MSNQTTQTVLLLNSLKTILANPALRSSGDTTIAGAMEHVDTVLAGLIARNADAPRLAADACASYTQLLPKLQQLLGAHASASTAVADLRAAIDAAPASIDALLPAASRLFDALYAVDTPEARTLAKQLADIEADYSRSFNAALRHAKQPDADSAKAGAAHVKDYDEEALRRFIVAQYPDEQNVRIAKSSFLSGGHSKYTMGIELEGNRALPASLVLRADASAGFGGSSVTEEYRLLKVLHAHGACVAKPIAIEPTGAVFGSPFMLVEKRPGRSIGHMFVLPAPNAVTSRDVAAALAKLHGIPVDAFGDATPGATTSTTDYARAWIDQSYASWKALNTPGALMETSFRWLRDNVERYDGPRTLVHGDYGLNNMLIDGDRLTCILDWEFAHIGNPVYDLGYFRFQAEALGDWNDFLRAYAAAGGTVPDEQQLDYANLLAETRLTVMTRQAEAAYYAGLPLGVPGAINAAAGYRNTSDERIAAILDRVA